MISKFRKFIEKERLFKEDDKILLACSGGVDSMVLADLLLTNENKFGIAHINHQTRGAESDQDQAFVEDYCAANKLAFHAISAPIKNMAMEAKQNFHAFARAYRYEYLHNIMDQHDYQFIATAHHSSDTLETFLINLTRGTGLGGLTGIPVKNDLIVRPLMFYNKEDIINYANKFKVSFREDASNKTTKYTRNHIRHEIVPEIEKLSLDAIINAKSTINKLRKTKNLLDELILHGSFIKQEKDKTYISKKMVLDYNENSTLLFYLIRPFGFNFSQAEQIIAGVSNVGSMYLSPTHHLLIDRENILIEKVKSVQKTNIIIDGLGSSQLLNGSILNVVERDELEISTDKNVEYFDIEKLSFPLLLRTWEDGDRFRPIGMGGKQKKVKDLLIDSKTNRLDKSDQLVLLSKNEIVWVVGQRISEDFKCDEGTMKFIRITFSAI